MSTSGPTSPEPETETAEIIAFTEAEQAHALQAQIEALQAQALELKDQRLRAVAEAENIRKRADRDVQEAVKYASAGLARDLVSVAENLQRAIDSVPKDALANDPLLKSLGEGVEMTAKELLGAFEKHGIRRIDPIGQKFDHNFHQAVAQIDHPTAEAGTVVQVLQAGYVMHERLLRPAMVGVAKNGDAQKTVDTNA